VRLRYLANQENNRGALNKILEIIGSTKYRGHNDLLSGLSDLNDTFTEIEDIIDYNGPDDTLNFDSIKMKSLSAFFTCPKAAHLALYSELAQKGRANGSGILDRLSHYWDNRYLDPAPIDLDTPCNAARSALNLATYSGPAICRTVLASRP